MAKKVTAKAPAKKSSKPRPVTSHTKPDPITSHTKLDEIDKLMEQLEAKEAEILELRHQLELALSQSQTNAKVVEELAHLKGVIAPFVKSAKGEHTTAPEDWELLKGLNV